jgi:multiple antibiotic resistance protein
MIQELIPIFITLFIVIDPLGIIPVYLSLSHTLTGPEKKRAILKSILTAFTVFTLFILIGRQILAFLGIQPGSFFIAGGILLFLISLDMLFGTPRRTKTSGHEEERTDIAVFPLGIPLIAGPGTITTIMLYASQATDTLYITASLFAVIILVLLLTAITMFLSSFFLKILTRTGVTVIERIMGIILSGLSIQFIYNGLLMLGLING